MKRIIFGFTNLHDLITTLFSKSITLNVFSIAWVWLLSVAGLIYNSKELVLILLLLMLADWITGVWKSIRVKTFNSYTFQRMLLNIPLKFGLIAFAYQTSLHSWIFEFLKIADIIMTGFLLTEFVSLIENIHCIDSRIIPDKMYKRLKQVMDLDTVIESYLKPKSAPVADATATDDKVVTDEEKVAVTASNEETAGECEKLPDEK